MHRLLLPQHLQELHDSCQLLLPLQHNHCKPL
jgi:hypothetical protein